MFLVCVLLETPPRTLNIRAKIQTKIPDSHYENPPAISFLGRGCMEAAIVQLWLVSAMHHIFINSLSSTFISIFCQNSVLTQPS